MFNGSLITAFTLIGIGKKVGITKTSKFNKAEQKIPSDPITTLIYKYTDNYSLNFF